MTVSCAIYLRISRDPRQDDLAVTRQREDCERVALERGWQVVETYSDTLSASRRDVKRPEYERMREDFDSRKFTALICWDLDRLTRQPRELEDWIDAAEMNGLHIVTANGEADLENDGGRMFARMKVAVARSEIERKSARQKRKNKQLADAGQPIKAARRFGYELDAVTPRESEAVKIRQAYDDLLNGASVHSITRGWNLEGFKPVRAERWSSAAVRTLLKRERNAGYVVYQGVRQPTSTIQPIVSVAIFEQAQAILANPDRMTGTRGPKVVKYWLSGLIECSVCGSRLTPHKGSYKCARALDRAAVSDGIRHVAVGTHIAEAEAVELLHGRLHAERQRMEDAAGASVAAIRADIASARADVTRAGEDYKARLIDGALYKAVKSEADNRIASLEADLAASTMQGVTAELMKLAGLVWSASRPKPLEAFKAAFNELSVDDKRRLFSIVPGAEVLPKVAKQPHPFHPERLVKVPRLRVK